MNIFATDPDPMICAQNLDDKRVVKMCLETAQIICTACHALSLFDAGIPYRATHKRHPVVQWTIKSLGNLSWATRHFFALAEEYSHRYGKQHACLSKMANFKSLVELNCTPTPFANCARNSSIGIDFTEITDVNEAYRLYLAQRWKHDIRNPTWTNRQRPNWA